MTPNRSLWLLPLALLAPRAAADTVIVQQIGTTFQPADIVVQEGDTVRWEYTGGSHDVTEGTDGTIDGDEAFFGPLTPTVTSLEVTFDAAFLATWPRAGNVYDYFCSPHFFIGMVGTVTVTLSSEAGTRYCGCDGNGGQPSCGNLGSADSGCANSTGVGAELRALGTTSVAVDDLSLQLSAAAPTQPALLFVGTNAVAQGDGIPFGDGLRCAGGAVVRLGVAIPDANGDASWGPGLASAAGWSGGDTRYLQAWYRDPSGGPCGSGFNLSNGVEVLLAP